PERLWEGIEVEEIERILARYGVADVTMTGKQATAVDKLRLGWLRYSGIGQIWERGMKTAGMLYVERNFPNETQAWRRRTTRELAGSPDFLNRAQVAPLIESQFLFYGPAKEGLRAHATAIKRDPAGYATKLFMSVMLAKAIAVGYQRGLFSAAAEAAAAAAGEEDDPEEAAALEKLRDKEQQMRHIPWYDLAAYHCFPIGWYDEDEDRVVYVRIPVDEAQRAAGGMLFEGLQDAADNGDLLDTLSGMVGYGSSQIPSAAPGPRLMSDFAS
ncbi:unnamed protein product, partial [marine sediment metagenome]